MKPLCIAGAMVLALLLTAAASALSPKEVVEQMRPSTGIEPEPRSIWDDWPAYAMVAGVVLLGIGLGAGMAIRLAGKRSAKPQATAQEAALKELTGVEALGLPDKGEFERYHTELSSIVRRYLERRFGLAATRQTTAEFLESMKTSTALLPAQQALLRDFLEQCDLAKFAGAKPTVEQCGGVAAAARRLVQQTSAINGFG
jgi:hypothetical protein